MFVHSCITRYSGWRSGRGEFSTADKRDIAAAAARREEGDGYSAPLLAASCVNNENEEENFWVNRKTRTPVTIPYRTCNFGERVFNAGENFQSWRKASITAKLGGKIPCRSSRIPPRAKINRRRFTVSKRYFFLSAQFRCRTASRINWNNICRGFS